jgi:NADH-quinone oxidoreductase subunit M
MLGESNAVTAVFADLDTHEKLVLYPIVILVILIGVFPTPLLAISEVAVDDLLAIISNYQAMKAGN